MTCSPYIAFEGPIGAGKTTLAGLLASHLKANLILEDIEGNEFLADFYGDKPRWALGMQLSFLSSRHEQLKKVGPLRDQAFVADYSQAKDDIFAGMLLRDRELRLYAALRTGLMASVAEPNLVVYLDAGNEVLLKRIEHRNRSYEKRINAGYLDGLREAYESYFMKARALRLMRYDTSMLRLDSETQLNLLFSAIVEKSQSKLLSNT
jgi:deoxyguanosine kinase